MSAALDAIVADVRRRAAQRRRTQTFERLEEHVKQDSWRRERVLNALAPPGFHFLCEMKRRSATGARFLEEPEDTRRYGPSRRQRIGPRWHAFAEACKQGGAAALAVVTEADHFDGALDDLRSVEFARLPRIQRDYVLDESMVLEACLYGADALTLMPELLDDEALPRLRAFCREYGVAVLVEVRDDRELDRVLPLEPELIEVDAHDPGTGALDTSLFERLIPRVPRTPGGPIAVARGGLASLEDLRRMRADGADAVLVGEALLKAEDPAATLAAWRAALRNA